MKTAQKTLIAIAALAAATASLAPAMASAQTTAVVRVDYGRGDWDRSGWDRSGWGNDHRGGWDNDRRGGWDNRASMDLDRRIGQLHDRIHWGERSGQLSHREADRLSDRLDRIEDTKRAYERSGRGLDGREIASLNDSLDRLSADIRYQGHDRDRW